MTTVWLVILVDRHGDDLYKAASKLGRAQEIARELMGFAEYRARKYEWKPDNEFEMLDEKYPPAPGAWVFRHTVGFDDGPRLHIERVEVDESKPRRKA